MKHSKNKTSYNMNMKHKNFDFCNISATILMISLHYEPIKTLTKLFSLNCSCKKVAKKLN